MTSKMLMGASCLILSAAAPWATASAQTETEGADQDAVPVTSGAEEDDVKVYEGIIVTATRRAEKLSEVPIAMSVFGDDAIDQTSVRELSEMSEYIPNVSISGHNDFRSVITIRGVGSASRNIGFDSRVGVYVDGVYMGQSPAVNQELLDLERVEVLRGPQGMLFGKNTVAGAISLVTKKPKTLLPSSPSRRRTATAISTTSRPGTNSTRKTCWPTAPSFASRRPISSKSIWPMMASRPTTRFSLANR